MTAVATRPLMPNSDPFGVDAVMSKEITAVPSEIPDGTDAEANETLAVVPRSVPAGADAEINKQLAAIWGNMEQRMAKLAKMSQGKDYDKNLKPEDVMKNLDAVRSARLKNSEKWGTIRQTVSNTLDVITNVGGMVADAASQVFAPAGQCYNALNFVINAYKGYASIFETLNDLFKKCASFLGRLHKYSMANMSRELSVVACEVLSHFVDICDKALTLRTSRMFKIKTMAKIAFLQQNEFSESLGAMDDLTRDEELERGADMYLNGAETLNNSRNIMGVLEQDRTERTEQSKEKKDRNIVLRVLNFSTSPDVWDGNGPIATWGSTYQNIRHRTVEGTGQWLLGEREFTDWVKKNSEAPVLGITGGEASGKSYLAASIASHLLANGSGEAINSRQLVAFYFVDERKANAGIEVLGKSIIWQFAQNDASYMQSAAATCRKDRNIEPKELLTRLLLENHKELKAIDATFYIVLNKIGDSDDNVHDGVFNFLLNASRASKGSVRVLFTATEGTAKKLQSRGLKCPTVSMDRNADDVRKYIDARLDKMDNLSDKGDDQVNAIRKIIQTRLYTETGGNYYMMEKTLNKISKLDLDTDIYNELDKASRSLTDHIEDDVRDLNRRRSKKELEEINEVVLWITFAKERMSIEKMKAVLQLKNNAASLRPLEDRLRKFLLFEIDNNGYVNFRSEQILDKLPQRAQTAKERLQNNEEVNQGEVDILKHFLGNVCPPDLVQKLGLEEHFDQKLSPRQEQIYQEDKNNANFQLARACLHALTSETHGQLRVLRGYAVRHLVDHMHEVDLASIDPDSKRKLGPHLVRLFHDGAAIDNLFWAKKETPDFPDWLRDEETVRLICTWLKATSADTQSSEKEKDWLNKLMADGQDRVKTIAEPSVLRMAHYCFEEDSDFTVTSATFEIVKRFVTEHATTTEHQGAASFTDEQIEEWCLKRLPTEQPNSRWHTQMAFVLSRSRDKEAAEARCCKALDLDPNNWRASVLLARFLKSNKDAIAILKKLVARYGGDSAWMAENREELAQMEFGLGHRYWSDQQLDKAKKWYSACIEHGPARYHFPTAILLRYKSVQWWNEMMDVIEQLRSKSHLTPMMLALTESPRNEMVQIAMLEAGVNTNNLGVFDDVYKGAIESAAKARRYRASFSLRRGYASALAARHPCPTDDIMKVLEAAAADVPYTNTDLAATFFLVGYRLGTIYLDKAKAAKEAGHEDEAKDWLRRMSSVVPEQVTENQMRLPLSLFAARYYYIYNDLESARSMVHNTLRMAVELLSDDDSTNDMLAFQKILYAVIPFKDEVNAAAALAMMKLEAPGGSFSISCSCSCGHTWKEPGDMWWCMDCINVVLTSECKDDIKNRNVCWESHKHFYIPKWDEEKMSSNRPKNHVPWNGMHISIDKWRKEITKAYHLTKS
ncbi:hypothetical protein N7474_010746 [Penicillium riverlandense]|uniref:uncharacterized protein n=1 Tax=Penicillium riverlandense TaxID=1903569 RepID=UPI00254891D9|nr:uncharacterized protein N7474_010746 [Penicillium riverlandense]KAJ5804859.1 hypothetical protein N7474_010746 [Penicillium riverlandense]